MKLYWVQTVDHFEDWFIVASSNKIACRGHENNEGFNEGDANAKFICDIPPSIIDKFKGNSFKLENGDWPPLEMLKELGFEFIDDLPPYVVKGYGQIFSMGKSVIALIQNYLDGKQGVYFLNIRNTCLFKVGITNKITRRLKEIKTSNPYTIDLWYFIETPNPRKIEGLLHNSLNIKRQSGEWFELKTLGEIFDVLEVIDNEFDIKIHNVLSFYDRI